LVLLIAAAAHANPLNFPGRNKANQTEESPTLV